MKISSAVLSEHNFWCTSLKKGCVFSFYKSLHLERVMLHEGEIKYAPVFFFFSNSDR